MNVANFKLLVNNSGSFCPVPTLDLDRHTCTLGVIKPMASRRRGYTPGLK